MHLFKTLKWFFNAVGEEKVFERNSCKYVWYKKPSDRLLIKVIYVTILQSGENLCMASEYVYLAKNDTIFQF